MKALLTFETPGTTRLTSHRCEDLKCRNVWCGFVSVFKVLVLSMRYRGLDGFVPPPKSLLSVVKIIFLIEKWQGNLDNEGGATTRVSATVGPTTVTYYSFITAPSHCSTRDIHLRLASLRI